MDKDQSPLSSSPPAKSPVKSPPAGTPLPPVNQGSLQISKRRRLEPSSPTSSDQESITPIKNRSFSTPTRSGAQGRRTPSLQDRPIPTLSPPSPGKSGAGTPVNRELTKNSSPLASIPASTISENSNNSTSLAVPPSSASSSSSAGSSSSVLESRSSSSKKDQRRYVSSPLLARDLKKQNDKLDREIRNWKRLVDLARRAGKYEAEGDSDKLEKLISGWRSAAQGAANYLLNESRQKIEAMGGIEEYKRRLKEDAEAQAEDEKLDLDQLSEEQREEYERLKEEYSLTNGRYESKDGDDDDEQNEFGMEQMLKTLNIDYRLLFPE